MSSRSPEVDAYIAAQPAARQETLEAVRALVHETLSEVREGLEYRMPAFFTSGLICTLAAQKQYFALYICKPALLDRHREALAGLNLGKGCIRFKRFEALPVRAIQDLLLDAAKDPGWDH